MDDLDYLQENMERTPPVIFRAIPREQCKKCLTPMESQHLEGGLCIDCDIPELRKEVTK
jgi:hypothetical protein